MYALNAAASRSRVTAFLVSSESLLDGGNLAVLADPKAQCLQPASEEHPSSNDPHAPPPTSGARRALADRLRRRPRPGTCRPAWRDRATRPRATPPSCRLGRGSPPRRSVLPPRPAGAGSLDTLLGRCSVHPPRS